MNKFKKIALTTVSVFALSVGIYATNASATDVIVLGCQFTGDLDDQCTTGALIITKCKANVGGRNCAYTPGEVEPITP